MSTISSSMHSAIGTLKKDLQASSVSLERQKKLYYLAAAISAIAAAAFLAASFFTFQTITAPFWVGLAGPIAAQFIGCTFGTLTCKMLQNTQQVQKTVNYLKELQTTYKEVSASEFSDSDKIILPHYLLAKKQCVETENRLKELTQNTNASNLESNAQEIVILEHQMLISKIDFAFKSVLLCASSEGTLDNIIEENTLFKIPDQNPLIQNHIRGLNGVLKELSSPLVLFEANPSQNLSYRQVQEMPFDGLEKHIFTAIQKPLEFNPLNS